MSSQWIRKVSLLVSSGSSTLDLSDMHIVFGTNNADVESPNSAEIRVLNLHPETAAQIQKDYTQVILSAGYQQGNFGNIFSGVIKQFRAGRLSDGVTTYLDILAADGDVFYNQGIVAESLKSATTPQQAMEAVAKSAGVGTDFGGLKITEANNPSLRGQVLFGLARARLRNLTSSLDAGWSIQGGVVVVTDNTGYRDGETLVLNRSTGLVGTPEQTATGIAVTCLLNSRVRIGGLVQLSQDEMNTTELASGQTAPVAYDSYALYNMAATRSDGLYRAFAVSHEGDSRGQAWYSRLVLLAIDPTTEK